MSAPALRASSCNSASDSRPCSPTGIPGNRGERFQPTPTRRTRSALEISCVDFIKAVRLDHSVEMARKANSLFLQSRLYLVFFNPGNLHAFGGPDHSQRLGLNLRI